MWIQAVIHVTDCIITEDFTHSDNSNWSFKTNLVHLIDLNLCCVWLNFKYWKMDGLQVQEENPNYLWQNNFIIGQEKRVNTY